MAVEVNTNARPNERVTKGTGNAKGRPIIPVLLAVVAVVILMVIYQFGTGKHIEQDTSSPRSSSNYTYQVPPSTNSSAGTGMGPQQTSFPAARPAETSVSGSSSLPTETSGTELK